MIYIFITMFQRLKKYYEKNITQRVYQKRKEKMKQPENIIENHIKISYIIHYNV